MRLTDSLRRCLLVAALVVGCLLSGLQILHDARLSARLPPGAAARVNGTLIDLDSVNRTVAAMDLRVRRDEAAAQYRVVTRLIDEELLVQHALDTGAAQSSPEVRAALVRSAITRLNEEAAAEPISDHELQDYFQAHRQTYAAPVRFEVTPFYFESRAFPDLTQAQARAAAAQTALHAGQTVDQVLARADAPPFTAPEQLVTARTLGNYVGPARAAEVAALLTGQTTPSEPFDRGVSFMYLRRKTGGDIPALADIRELVLADAMRDRQERALQSLLDALHRTARIDVADLSRRAQAGDSVPRQLSASDPTDAKR